MKSYRVTVYKEFCLPFADFLNTSLKIKLSPKEQSIVKNLRPGQVAKKTIIFTSDKETANTIGNCCPKGMACGPWERVPGGRLHGEVVLQPVADWSFTAQHRTIAVETRRLGVPLIVDETYRTYRGTDAPE